MRMRIDKLIKPELEHLLDVCNFTEEEEIVFICLSKGKTLTEISFDVGLSVSTVRRRINGIISKIERCGVR